MKRYIFLFAILLSVCNNVLAQTNSVRYLFLIRDPEVKVYLKLDHKGNANFSYEGTLYGYTYSKDNYKYYGTWEEQTDIDGRRYVRVKHDYDRGDSFITLKFPDLPRQNYSHLNLWLDGSKQVRCSNTRSCLTFDEIGISEAQSFTRSKMNELRDAAYQKNKKAGEDFLAVNAKKEGVVVLPSGLQYIVLKQGTGAVAKVDDKVRVRYESRLIDGTVFDASAKHDDDGVVFQPKQLIKGWTEALTLMPVGSKWQLFIPQELAYGQRGAGQDIKPYSALIFDVEVLAIENEK